MFDGKKKCANYSESEKPNPCTIYGKTKLAAEELVLQALPHNSVIFRASVIYGPPPPLNSAAKNSFAQWLQIELTKIAALDDSKSPYQPLSIFEDEFRNFIFVDDICNICWECFDKESLKSSLYHLGGPKRCSRVEFAETMCSVLNPVWTKYIKPTKLAELGTNQSVYRPPDLSMDCSLIKSEFKTTFTTPNDGLTLSKIKL